MIFKFEIMQAKVSLCCTVTGRYEYYKIQVNTGTYNSKSRAVNGVNVLDLIVVCLE